MMANSRKFEEKSHELFFEDMVEWCGSLGFNKNGSDEFKAMVQRYPKEDRTIWRHVMKHVLPKKHVELIKKNILLSKLKQERGVSKLQATVATPKDLEVYKKYKVLEKKVESMKALVETTESRVRDLNMKIRMKDYQIAAIEEETKNSNQKATVIKLKCRQVEKDISDFTKKIEIVMKVCSNELIQRDKARINEMLSKVREEMERMHWTHSIAWNETIEQNLILTKMEEIVYFVSPNDFMSFLTETLDRTSDKMEHQLFNDPSWLETNCRELNSDNMEELQKMQVNMYKEYTQKTIENRKLEKDVEVLRNELAERILQKLQFEELDMDIVSDYLIKKCRYVSQIKRSEHTSSQLAKFEREVEILLFYRNTVDELHKKIKEMNERIDEKVKVTGDYFNVILSGSGANRINDVKGHVNKLAMEIVYAEEDNPFERFHGSLKDEIMLFLKTPLQRKNRPTEKNPLPSLVKHFPRNRSEHELPLRLLIQQLQLKSFNTLISEHSSLKTTELDKGERVESIKKKIRDNELEVENELNRVEQILHSTKEVLNSVIEYNGLLREESSFNQVLTKDDTPLGEKFISYEKSVKDYVNTIRNE